MRICHNLIAVVLCASLYPVGALATPGSTLMKHLGKQLTREGGEEAAIKIGKEVGQPVIERVAVKVAKEGGDQSLEAVSVMVAKHGSDVIRALDNASVTKPILTALDELPGEQIPQALGRLAAGKAGKELADTTIRYGSKALRSEVAHPGIGGRFVQVLGNDGAALSGKLTTDQAIMLGRHLDDIATLPPSQQKELVKVMTSQTDRFVTFVGRFVEQNPGKVLFTAAGTGLLITESERILGGDEIVMGPDGMPIVVSKPGIVGKGGQAINETLLRPTGEAFSWLSRGLAVVIVLAVSGFVGILLWGVWKRQQKA